MGQHDVQREQLAQETGRLDGAPVAIVRLLERCVEPLGEHVDDLRLAPVDAAGGVVAAHQIADEPRRHTAVPAAQERRDVAADEVPAEQQDQAQEGRLARRVAEGLEALEVDVGAHRDKRLDNEWS